MSRQVHRHILQQRHHVTIKDQKMNQLLPVMTEKVSFSIQYYGLSKIINFKSVYGTPVDKPTMDVREFVVCYIPTPQSVRGHILPRSELHSFLNRPPFLLRHSSYHPVIMSTQVYTIIIRNHLIISQIRLHSLPIRPPS